MAMILISAARNFGRIRTLSDREFRNIFSKRPISCFLVRIEYIVSSDESWKQRVRTEVSQAAVVLIDATETSSSVEWEKSYCRNNAQEKTILLTLEDTTLVIDGYGEKKRVDFRFPSVAQKAIESLVGQIYSRRELIEESGS
jgi:hypothetical protein